MKNQGKSGKSRQKIWMSMSWIATISFLVTNLKSGCLCDYWIWRQGVVIFIKPFRNFRSRRWGPRSRVRARGTLRSAPHWHWRNFSGTRVCRVAFKHLPQPLRSHIRSFRSLRRFLNFCPTHYVIVRGGGWSPTFFFIGILIIKWHTGACKISKSYDNFSIISPSNMS